MAKHLSEAQVKANQANAQHSTGPVTPEGKEISSHNALKTGLTGRTILLPNDDLAQYQSHLKRLDARYQPKTDEERQHVETLAHIEWRLLRIPTLETGLLALGRKRLADLHPNEPAHTRASLIEVEVLLEYQKPLANLALQEQRLNRQHDRELAKLTALQTTHRQKEKSLIEEAARFFLSCKENNDTFYFNDMKLFGFKFSMDDILSRASEILAKKDNVVWSTIQAKYHLCDLKKAA